MKEKKSKKEEFFINGDYVGSALLFAIQGDVSSKKASQYINGYIDAKIQDAPENVDIIIDTRGIMKRDTNTLNIKKSTAYLNNEKVKSIITISNNVTERIAAKLVKILLNKLTVVNTTESAVEKAIESSPEMWNEELREKAIARIIELGL